MMRSFILSFFIILFIPRLEGASAAYIHLVESDMVTANERITIPGCEYVYNPSIVKYDEGYLLVFRCDAGPGWTPPFQVGVVRLNSFFKPISEAQILPIPAFKSKEIVKNEDPRVIEVNGKYYVLYNESWHGGNDMHLCQIHENDGVFESSTPIQLERPASVPFSAREKNWVPFEYDGTLLLGYSIEPHLILLPNLKTGETIEFCKSKSKAKWNYGELRGGTPALLVDGNYLAFFHSSRRCVSNVTNKLRFHYFMGAYVFSKDPPFKIEKVSPRPIIGKDFYLNDEIAPFNRHVVFPCGFVEGDSSIYVVYGRNDQAIYVATVDKKALLTSLVSVK